MSYDIIESPNRIPLSRILIGLRAEACAGVQL